MPKTEPFDEYPARYEDWFRRNRFAFESELWAVREQLPESGRGIEIGAGSGQFAIPLGIKLGVEPSKKMREILKKKGIEVVGAVAENLPFVSSQFDFALMVTTICFVDDLEASLREAYRVLKPGGSLIIGFIDRESPIGKFYLQHKEESVFYKIATFYSVTEVVANLKTTGFKNLSFTQTLFHKLPEVKDIEPIKEGYGEGSFVIIKAVK